MRPTISVEYMTNSRFLYVTVAAAVSLANRVAVGAYHFALGYFFHQKFYRGITRHLSDVAKFRCAWKMVKLQGGGMDIVSAICASLFKFDLVDDNNAFSKSPLVTTVCRSLTVGNARTFKASAIGEHSQAISRVVPVVVVLAKLTEVVVCLVKLRYSSHRSPPPAVGRAGGADNTARPFRAICYQQRPGVLFPKSIIPQVGDSTQRGAVDVYAPRLEAAWVRRCAALMEAPA